MPTLIQSKPLVIFAGEVKSEGLSWQAFGASVSNFANQWLKIDTGSRVSFAAPLSRGTFAIPGDQVVHLTWEAPSGQTQPAATANQIAYVTVTSERLPDNGGPIGSVPLAAADIFVYYGLLAGLPAPSTLGRIAYTTDTGQFWRDTGAAWVALPIGKNAIAGGYWQTLNNDNAVSQTDQYGNRQNIAIMDNDENVIIGPGTDFHFVIMTALPFNENKVHWMDDFVGAALSPLWTQTLVGGGNVGLASGDVFGQCFIRTGAVAGDTAKLSLPLTLFRTDGRGAAMKFHHAPENALNQILTFGCEDAATTSFVRFRLTEVGAAANYQCETSDGIGTTTVDSGQLRTGARFIFGIDIRTAGLAEFWINNGVGGLMRKVASINTTLPAVGTNLTPFMKSDNPAGGVKGQIFDLVYLLRNR